ncbi:OmpA family protein [Vibrio sp. H11]|uniref:OmpA family protein n=1 Tax=Vibrio sp. H11 TaxID=2565928 RepID=UPI001F0D4275|nr:OmpA family protein [Vibrio sp. H11]
MKAYASYDNSMAYFNDREVSKKCQKYFSSFMVKLCSVAFFSSAILLSPKSFSEDEIIYPMDESSWIYKGGTFNCTLMHTEVPQGKFYFRSNKKDNVTLEYRFNSNQSGWIYAQAGLLTPPWIKPLQADTVSQGQINSQRGFSFSSDIERILHSMKNGKWLTVSVGGSEASSSLKLILPTIRIQSALDQFAECRQRLPLITYREARDMTLHYQAGQQNLTAAQRGQLKALMSYVRLDKRVTQVLIDGHTDSDGARLANLAVSRKRAEQVAEALKNLGLDGAKVQVRAHGSRYPLASNHSEQGRAKNRRVAIRLVRDNESVVNSAHTNNKIKVK